MRILLLAFTLFTNMYASVSQGKLIYKKECLSCHIEGKYLASTKKAKEWKELLIENEKSNKLAQLHFSIKKTDEDWSYFKQKDYLQDSNHLKNLLQKYSSDRGKHNSCY